MSGSTIDFIGRDYGIVTLSQIERNSPINVNVVARDFNDLACCSTEEIRLIALNEITPLGQQIFNVPKAQRKPDI
jgi:hypothetical protein